MRLEVRIDAVPTSTTAHTYNVKVDDTVFERGERATSLGAIERVAESMRELANIEAAKAGNPTSALSRA